MPGRVTESKTALIKRIVDIDVALLREGLPPEKRRELQKQRDRLERRVYRK